MPPAGKLAGDGKGSAAGPGPVRVSADRRAGIRARRLSGLPEPAPVNRNRCGGCAVCHRSSPRAMLRTLAVRLRHTFPDRRRVQSARGDAGAGDPMGIGRSRVSRPPVTINTLTYVFSQNKYVIRLDGNPGVGRGRSACPCCQGGGGALPKRQRGCANFGAFQIARGGVLWRSRPTRAPDAAASPARAGCPGRSRLPAPAARPVVRLALPCPQGSPAP